MKIVAEPFRVLPGSQVDLAKLPTKVARLLTSKKHYKHELEQHVAKLDALQRLFYASDRWAVLFIFQGMDAAGKDGAIRHVMSGSIHKAAGSPVLSNQAPKICNTTFVENRPMPSRTWRDRHL